MIILREKCLWLVSYFQWLPGLLSRITLGYIFIQSGWGKLHHLDKVIGFFTSLGIPAPQVQAPVVAGLEFSCGVLVLLGLLARLAALPLIGTMVVAILTAKLKEISDLGDLFSLSEYLFIVSLVWLIVKGPGAVSLDALLAKKFRARLKTKGDLP